MKGSLKVTALIEGHISVDGTWTQADFLELAIAALDQAGVSAPLQRRVNELALDELEVARCSCGAVFFNTNAASEHLCMLGAFDAVDDDALSVARRRVIANYRDAHGHEPHLGFDIDAVARELVAQERAS